MRQGEAEQGIGLVADVGGTNVRFALAPLHGALDRMVLEPRQYRAAAFPGIIEAAKAYLNEVAPAAQPRTGVFALAGVVRGDDIKITNGDWRFHVAVARRALEFDRLYAVNDFEALGWAVPHLDEANLKAIASSELARPTRDGTVALVGPGSGLGVSAVHFRSDEPVVFATEGGHVGLAPVTEDEIEVLRCLQSRFEHVSYERVLSGQGLSNLYSALSTLRDLERRDVSPEEVTRRAALGDDTLARLAVDMFCGLLGAFAGDTVLMHGAWGGVYLAGGLVDALVATIDHGEFRRRFEDKGRFAAILAEVPTMAIMEPNVGLIGAAAVLRRKHAHATAERIQ
jgi:glucokinase